VAPPAPSNRAQAGAAGAGSGIEPDRRIFFWLKLAILIVCVSWAWAVHEAGVECDVSICERKFLHPPRFQLLESEIGWEASEAWDVAALLQAIILSIIVWFEAHGSNIRGMMISGSVALFVTVFAIGTSGTQHHSLYHWSVLSSVVLMTLADILGARGNLDKTFYCNVILYVDVPVVTSLLVLTLFVEQRFDPMGALRATSFYSGAVAFQLMMASICILVLSNPWRSSRRPRGSSAPTVAQPGSERARDPGRA
jgi:hypothetical protein